MPWQVLVFSAGTLLALSAVLLRPAIRSHLIDRTDVILARANTALDQGNIPEALRLAEFAVKESRQSGRLLGPALMTLGRVRARQAAGAAGVERHVQLTEASRLLADAAEVGVPREQESQLFFDLGNCLLGLGQIGESIAPLERCAAAGTARRADALRLLIRTFLDPSQDDPVRAHQANIDLLAAPGLTEQEVAECLALRLHLLERLGRRDYLAGLADPIGPSARQWFSTLADAQERSDDGRADEAVTLCRHLTGDGTVDLPTRRRAWFILGVVQQKGGDRAGALATFLQTERTFADTDEAAAAAARAALILFDLERTEEALAALARSARALSSGAGSDSTLLQADSLSQLMAETADRLRSRGRFEAAVNVIETSRLVVTPAVADRAAAELYDAWARATLSDAASANHQQAAQARTRAAAQFRAAGELSLKVAENLNSPAEAAPVLWQAAQQLYRGESHVAAVAVIERLLAGGAAEHLRPEALALASASLDACGKHDAVATWAQQCIRDYPNHPAAMLARFHLARSQLARGDVQSAETSLRANLAVVGSEGDPNIERESRWLLAKLLYDHGRDEEALLRLNEVLAASPDADTLAEARFLLADCLRRRARSRADLIDRTHSQAAKDHYQQQKLDDLERALEQLNLLQRELAGLETTSQASLAQLDVLRRCRWAIGQCLYELDRNADAIEIYSRIADTYDDPGIWLEAQVQIANCYARLNRIDSAHDVLRRARRRLDAMPEEEVERARIGMSETRWEQWINWIRRL